MSNNKPLSEALKLSAAERILLAQDLWDSVIGEPDAWQLSDAQRAELDRRLDAYRRGDSLSDGSSWDSVKGRIRRGA